jgi:hypothetical protein
MQKTHNFHSLIQNLIKLRYGRKKDDGSYIRKTVDPLFPLVPLATHIDHSKKDIFVLEFILIDPQSWHSRHHDVLLRRQVFLILDPLDVVQEAGDF